MNSIMAKWEELPIADRAQYMRVAVQNGYRDIRSIREAYNRYGDGGGIIDEEEGDILDKPFSYNRIPSVKYAEGGNLYETGGPKGTREQSIRRANYVASNYEDAKDFDMNPIVYAARKAAKDLVDRGGLSNCTLSATQWVDPSNPYMSARNIFDNPDSGYTEIEAENALPGDLLITKNPEQGTYHTMLIEGFDKNNKPLLRYSRGGHDTEENLVTGRTLKDYHIADKAQGGNHTEDHYFRPNVYNEHWLPEVVITAPRRR